MKISKGIFITFEGIEGSGKSTQIALFCDYLKQEGFDYIRTVEPGGTLIGDEIRKILLSVEHDGMTSLTELLLYAASRAQHVGEVIRPGLGGGKVVVCDRFSDSTMAYQGFGRGISKELIRELNAICTEGVTPDLTFLLDLEIRTGLSRNRTAGKVDRLELETIEFHERVRAGYHELARSEPERIKSVDGSGAVSEISERIREIFREFAAGKGHVV